MYTASQKEMQRAHKQMEGIKEIEMYLFISYHNF